MISQPLSNPNKLPPKMKVKNRSISILIIICLQYSCSNKVKQKKTQKTKPTNVVVIVMDDMGYGDLSSFGHPTINTPNIDKLANNGQKWTNFYAASSVCSPSRGALLTGRYPIRIGLAGNKERVFFPESKGGLPTEEITIAEMLKKIGYKTGIIGKWHLGHLPKFLPTNQGFDYYYGIPYSNDMDAINWSVERLLGPSNIKFWNVPLMENDSIIERPANQYTITKRYTEKAVEFIKKNKNEPFFLYLPHTMVHTPLFASEKFSKKSLRGLFGDVMSEVDWSVGRVIATLKELKLEKNTLVILTSDNGPWLMMREHGGSPGLLTNGKGTTWEGGMRVPGIFYMPGTIQPGTIQNLGATLDILPTIASFTNAKLPDDRILDGFDLSSVLKEKSSSKREHFFYYRKKELFAVRKGDYKAHFIIQNCYTDNDEKIILKKPLLFNVNIDPSEQYDHSDQHPKVLNKINTLVDNHKKTIVIKTSELDKYATKK